MGCANCAGDNSTSPTKSKKRRKNNEKA